MSWLITVKARPKERTVVSTNKARQAVTGNNVRYVLGFGLLAVVIAFAVDLFHLFRLMRTAG